MAPPTQPALPRLQKGGLVLIEPETARVLRVVALQYNPESISRALQPQMTGGEAKDDRSEPLTFTGPPVETIRFELEFDATDQPEKGEATAGNPGIWPQLSALELAVSPTTAQLQAAHSATSSGAHQIAPMPAPICLFYWGERRIVPVKVVEFNVIEEAFDLNLNPTRAKVSLGLRVLSVVDLGFEGKAAGLYLQYLQHKEEAAAHIQATLNSLGGSGISRAAPLSQ
jgi:hypothetical protein